MAEVPIRHADGGSALSILVVSYNSRQATLDCLRSIQEATRNVDAEIIVVENGSDDDLAAALRSAFAEPRILELTENVGFGRGCNAGAEVARGARLLLINSDAIVPNTAIEAIAAFADAHPEAGIWGGRILRPDGSWDPASCWRFPGLWGAVCLTSGLAGLFPGSRLFNAEGYGGWARDSVRRVDVVSGCFMLIDRSLWDTLEGFDPVYFMYSEDFDFCRRARDHGARAMLTPEAEIVHDRVAAERNEASRAIMILKGKVTYMRRRWSRPRALIGRFLLLLWVLRRALSLGLLSRISRRPSRVRTAADWGEVWRARRDWMRGYR